MKLFSKNASFLLFIAQKYNILQGVETINGSQLNLSASNKMFTKNYLLGSTRSYSTCWSSVNHLIGKKTFIFASWLSTIIIMDAYITQHPLLHMSKKSENPLQPLFFQRATMMSDLTQLEALSINVEGKITGFYFSPRATHYRFKFLVQVFKLMYHSSREAKEVDLSWSN